MKLSVVLFVLFVIVVNFFAVTVYLQNKVVLFQKLPTKSRWWPLLIPFGFALLMASAVCDYLGL